MFEVLSNSDSDLCAVTPVISYQLNGETYYIHNLLDNCDTHWINS
jgi:hypothetical protein